jgi:hypothetical protein
MGVQNKDISSSVLEELAVVMVEVVVVFECVWWEREVGI